jgi:hypothetical protein
MPNNPTDKPTCFMSRHLPGHLYKAHDVMLAYTRGGTRVFNAAVKPTFANMLNCTEQAATDCLEKLRELGWIVRHGGGRHASTGKMMPYEYDVLTHDQFVKKHPGSCPPLKYPVTEEDRDRNAMTFSEMEASNLFRSRILPAIALGEAIDEWAAQLSDDRRAAVLAHWKELPSQPQPTSEGLPKPASAGAVPSGLPEPSLVDYNEPSLVHYQNRPQSTRENLIFTALQHPTTTAKIRDEDVAAIPTADKPVVVVVVTDKDKDTSNVVDTLVSRFVTKEGDRPKKFGTKQRSAMQQLVSTHGEEKFLRAGAAWLRANPWDGKTESHFAEFITNFSVYDNLAQRAEREAKRNADDKEIIKRSRELAQKVHNLFSYLGTNPYFRKLPAGDQQRYKMIEEKPYGTWTAEDEQFIDTLKNRVAAMKQEEKGLGDAALVELFGPKDDGTPDF